MLFAEFFMDCGYFMHAGLICLYYSLFQVEIVIAQLNLNSSWEWQVIGKTTHHHLNFQAIYEADFQYKTLFWPN